MAKGRKIELNLFSRLSQSTFQVSLARIDSTYFLNYLKIRSQAQIRGVQTNMNAPAGVKRTKSKWVFIKTLSDEIALNRTQVAEVSEQSCSDRLQVH